jgi:hypothetical protein
MTFSHAGKTAKLRRSLFFPALSQLHVLMLALILGVVAFSFLVPVVPVARVNCLNPGCGGPQYDSITDYTLGVGWSAAFVSPDAQYGWIALLAVVMFCIAVGYCVLLIFRAETTFGRPKNKGFEN